MKPPSYVELVETSRWRVMRMGSRREEKLVVKSLPSAGNHYTVLYSVLHVTYGSIESCRVMLKLDAGRRLKKQKAEALFLRFGYSDPRCRFLGTSGSATAIFLALKYAPNVLPTMQSLQRLQRWK